MSPPPGPSRPPPPYGGSAPRGPPRFAEEERPRGGTPRKRMMAQGRKAHFMHDAKALLARLPGGPEEPNVRAFLEGLFARGARQSTADAQQYLDEKLEAKIVTPEQRQGLGRLVEQYSFWR